MNDLHDIGPVVLRDRFCGALLGLAGIA